MVVQRFFKNCRKKKSKTGLVKLCYIFLSTVTVNHFFFLCNPNISTNILRIYDSFFSVLIDYSKKCPTNIPNQQTQICSTSISLEFFFFFFASSFATPLLPSLVATLTCFAIVTKATLRCNIFLSIKLHKFCSINEKLGRRKG